MGRGSPSNVAIVDFGLGNLFSVKQACQKTGIAAAVTSDPEEVATATAVILPGVGAFGDAMQTLKMRSLDQAVLEAHRLGKPIFGICLGMQLLMSTSHEFGKHDGLGLIEGDVVPFQPGRESSNGRLKVPHIGWEPICRPVEHTSSDTWAGGPLAGLRNGEYMYFVHSFYVKPSDVSVVTSISSYGGTEFCSSLRKGRVVGFQFHPERSGPEGLRIYENLARFISK